MKLKISTKISVTLVAILLISSLVLGYGFLSNKKNGYKYFIVRNEDIVQKVEIAGSVQSSSFADLSFQVSGKVTDVN
ncbi:MAG: hypothetical protein ACI9GH_000520, partial [Candidatus Paceibacteria bacterium]